MSSYQSRVSLCQSLGKCWLEINKMRLLRRVNIPTFFSGNIMIVVLKTPVNMALNSSHVRSRRNFNDVTSFLLQLQKHRTVLGNSKRVISFYRFRQKYVLEYAEYAFSETANIRIK